MRASFVQKLVSGSNIPLFFVKGFGPHLSSKTERLPLQRTNLPFRFLQQGLTKTPATKDFANCNPPKDMGAFFRTPVKTAGSHRFITVKRNNMLCI